MRFLRALTLIALAASVLHGQGVTGRLEGTVQDPSRATIPGATVSVRNQETGYRAEVQTGQAGDYIVPNLPPGQYSITVAAGGFKSAETKDVVLTVNGLTTVNFTLQVGSRAETVQVDASGQLVDTVTSSMGQ